MKKLKIDDASVTIKAQWIRTGSVLKKTIATTPLEWDVKIQLVSNETDKVLTELVELAEISCFAKRALELPVSVETRLELNHLSPDV